MGEADYILLSLGIKMTWKTILGKYGLLGLIKDYWYRMDWRVWKYDSVKDYLVRNIFIMKIHHDAYNLPKYTGTDDEKMLKIQKWVINNMTYVQDSEKFNTPEKWEDLIEADASGVIQTLRGDCESGALLIYTLARWHKIPVTQLYYCAGDVKGGGHAWIEYKSLEQNKWHIVDWCYWPDTTSFKTRQGAEEDDRYERRWLKINDFLGE